MTYPILLPPNWSDLPGDAGQLSASITARDRKLASSAELARTVIPLADRLEAADALFVCSSDILRQEPSAARWYLDLGGLSRKLLDKLKERVGQFRLNISPDTLAANLLRGRSVTGTNLEAFSAWINAELDQLYPFDTRTKALALATVLGMNGARIQGQVQNMAGDDAVLMLKQLLVGAFSTRGLEVEAQIPDGSWVPFSPALNLQQLRHLRIQGRMVLEFVPGGNRPDLKITVDGLVVVMAEVKGRSDLSNVWESWMPQIDGHLRTWVSDVPYAPRVFFGTVITEEMIEGRARGGTRHTGLKAFHSSGLLSSVYNLSNIEAGHRPSQNAFDKFVDALCVLLR